LLRHRRDTHVARPWGFDDIMAEHQEYVETAVGEITLRGPLGPSDLPDPSHTGRRLPESWYGSVPRAVLEACFGRGQLAVTARRGNFSRVFDLAERVIPHEHYHRQLERHESERELLRVAARACGVATAADLADYFRMKVGEARPRLAELVDGGRLAARARRGWREAAVHPRDIGAPPLPAASAPARCSRPSTRSSGSAQNEAALRFDYRFEISCPRPSGSGGATSCRSSR